MEAVSNLTKFDFDKVYEMPIVDFFQYVAYINWKRKKEEKELREFQNKNRIKR